MLNIVMIFLLDLNKVQISAVVTAVLLIVLKPISKNFELLTKLTSNFGWIFILLKHCKYYFTKTPLCKAANKACSIVAKN